MGRARRPFGLLVGAIVVLGLGPWASVAAQESRALEQALVTANIAAARGESLRADQLYARLATAPEAPAKVYLYWARLRLDQGDLVGAERIVQAGRQRFIGNLPLLLALIEVRIAQGDTTAATQLLARLTPAERTRGTARYVEGLLAYALGQTAAAERLLHEAALLPHDRRARAWALLAQLAEASGTSTMAVRHYRRALLLARTAPERLRYAEQAGRLEQRREQAAIRWQLAPVASIQYDDNVNLAPLLFPETRLRGSRATAGLTAGLTVPLGRDQLAFDLSGHQAIHLTGDRTVLQAYDAGALGVRAAVRLGLPARPRLSLRYGAAYVPFRSEERRFSEAAALELGLAPRWVDNRFGVALEASRSHYYADNLPGTANDRSTATLDGRLRLSWTRPLGRLAPLLVLEGIRRNARGSNYDLLGGSASVGLGWRIASSWRGRFQLGYTRNVYPSHEQGRGDRLAQARLNLAWATNRRAIWSLSAGYERNDAGAESPFTYQRFLVSLGYRGAWRF